MPRKKHPLKDEVVQRLRPLACWPINYDSDMTKIGRTSQMCIDQAADNIESMAAWRVSLALVRQAKLGITGEVEVLSG
jgi:hypothetical protein